MPHRDTVNTWLGAYPEFQAQYALARRMQADVMDDLILETANSCTAADAHAAKVKIAAYQWRAAKLAPKTYGDKLEVDQITRAVVLAAPLTEDEWMETNANHE
jgi:hypothetical protein